MWNKLPRPLLIAVTTGLFSLCGFFLVRAVADGDKVKGVAYEAKKTSEQALAATAYLSAQVADVRLAIETNRKEYRDDRNRDSDVLRQMEDRIIRAVKS